MSYYPKSQIDRYGPLDDKSDEQHFDYGLEAMINLTQKIYKNAIKKLDLLQLPKDFKKDLPYL
jgi:hypothetical protein